MSNAETIDDLRRIAVDTIVTRDNFEKLLDWRQLEGAMRNGRWWAIRRNGRTQRWKTDANRIRVPIKAGMRSCSAITESDFDDQGRLNPQHFRIRMP